MDTKIQKRIIVNKPDFGRIFCEIAQKNNFSESKINEMSAQKKWNSLDVIKMNEKLFGNTAINNLNFNQNHRAYDEESIKEILNYQKKYDLNNSEMMRMFRISRNTIVKWQKLFGKLT